MAEYESSFILFCCIQKKDKFELFYYEKKYNLCIYTHLESDLCITISVIMIIGEF